MGLAVNGQCYLNELQAHDVYYSTVRPVINADGSLYKLERLSDGWYIGTQKLVPSLPQCDPVQNFIDGSEIGVLILGAVVVLLILKHVSGFLK